MNNIRPFQVVMLGIFALAGVGALIFLAAYQSSVSQEAKQFGDGVIVWGTLDAGVVNGIFSNVTDDIEAFGVVSYRELDERVFEDELVNAIAEGSAPDLIILDSTRFANLRTKLIPIPYSSFPIRDYRDAYVDGAEIFAHSDGIYAIPFAVDPIVQYWNRDMFSSNGLAQAPVSWEEIVGTVVPRLVIKNASRNVLRSAVAFGEYRNVLHAKDILMMLTLQSGSKMVTESAGKYTVLLDTPMQENTRAPLQATLQFYTDFSNANSPLYTWNRAMPTDKNAFLAGDLGLYYGYGSEFSDIAAKNPNLNFDISMVPQGSSATAKRTFGVFYGFAIPRAAVNGQGAYAVARILEDPYYTSLFLQGFSFGPVSRDIASAGSQNIAAQVIINSALIARGWLDPNPQTSDTIFMQMVEDIVSNRARVADAVDDAIERLILAF